MHASIWFWVLFNVFVLLMLVLDLWLFSRKPREVRVREALLWTLFWVGLAVGFGVLIRFTEGSQKALEFATGYVIEESLSMDNLFIFLLIFRYFKVPGTQQHRVLFWGIIGALVMRGIFIAVGVGLIRRFHWVIYAFGAFLIYSGIQMMVSKEKEIHPERNPVSAITEVIRSKTIVRFRICFPAWFQSVQSVDLSTMLARRGLNPRKSDYARVNE